MRTTVENMNKVEFDLSLTGIGGKERRREGQPLIRSCFYDFGVEQDATLVGFSRESKSTFVETLFSKLSIL